MNHPPANVPKILPDNLKFCKIGIAGYQINLIAAQDRGSFWFSYILNETLQYIEIWNEPQF